MTDITPSFFELQQLHAESERMRAEAAEILKRAEAKDRDGEYKLGQSDWRLRETQALEANISRREAALKAAGEPEFLARLAEADDKLKQAQELMQAYDRDRHHAAIYLRQCLEREKAREVVAH